MSDVLYLRADPHYNQQQLLIPSGAVNYPGEYLILDRNEKITDLIFRKDGLQADAYIELLFLLLRTVDDLKLCKKLIKPNSRYNFNLNKSRR